MKSSKKLIDLLVDVEGIRLEAYNDSSGFATIGIGHLLHRSPVDGTEKPITEAEAYTLCSKDVGWAETAINTYVKAPLSQNQFDALVSWTFNLGIGTLIKSTVLVLLNQQKYKEASDHMRLYNKSAGVVIPGLITRRTKEYNLFNS